MVALDSRPGLWRITVVVCTAAVVMQVQMQGYGRSIDNWSLDLVRHWVTAWGSLAFQKRGPLFWCAVQNFA